MRIIKAVKTPLFVSFTMLILCGLAYPLFTTLVAQAAFPYQANGSLLTSNGSVIGSELVGQDFTDPRLLKCRPSAVQYNTYTNSEKQEGTYAGLASGSANYNAGNPKLTARMQEDIRVFLAANPSVSVQDIPIDLITASGSGLDPHISPAAAAVQVPAIAKANNVPPETLKAIIAQNTSSKFLGLFGEETVNVLKVNLEISQLEAFVTNQ